MVGNPNAGKTTLFNALTGARQKVANYPGVTVERVSSQMRLGDETVECIDIPGIYSLTAASEDERVATAAILTKENPPDLCVIVLDGTNLERHLFLFTQIAEAGLPVVVAVTMTDRLEAKGQELSIAALSAELGVDCVAVIGHKEKGIAELKMAIRRNLREPKRPAYDFGLPEGLETELAELRDRLSRLGVDASLGEVRHSLYQPTEEFSNFLHDFPEVSEPYRTAREKLEAGNLLRPSLDVQSRYKWAKDIQERVVTRLSDAKLRKSRTDRIDQILIHRVWGLAIFIAVMYLVFQSIYTLATPVMGWIESGFSWIADGVSPLLESNPDLKSLIVDGLIGGVGGMLVFLPQILILFFFIAVLEGTGYLARAAFLMDRLLGWAGLNGRAFIPLLSSFACAIPGIMAARVMPDAKSRLATILVAPLMSCSARLPVYIILIGAFIEPTYGPFWAGFTLFAMHFVGMAVAIPVVFLLNRKVLKGRRLPFLLELPPYQWPKWRDVWLAMFTRGKVFVKTAGTIIVFMSALIWALSYYPRLSPVESAQILKVETEEVADKKIQERQLEQSYLGRFGKAIEPVFVPAGFDWRISTAILSAFPARETVVPSLGIIFLLGNETDEKSADLRKAMQEATWPDGRKLFTVWTAAGLMVFFALCAQCMATLATVQRETNSWKWPVFMFCYMTGLAYLAAVLIHQLSRLAGG